MEGPETHDQGRQPEISIVLLLSLSSTEMDPFHVRDNRREIDGMTDKIVANN